MYTRWVIIGLLVLALAIGALVYVLRTPNNGITSPPESQARPLKTYYDPTYGIAFNFPDNYEIKEHDATGEGTKHHSIVVGDKSALASTAEGGEGPPVITIDIFDNPTHQTPEKWIKGTSFSNYKLSNNATFASTTVAGVPALAYPWDGLYSSNSIVFQEKNKIYMLSVGYNSPDDQIRKDFAVVVASIQFDP